MRMPQGLQVFDKNGNITLDLTDRLTKVLGNFSTNGQKSGTIVDERLRNADGWAHIRFNAPDLLTPFSPAPHITFSDNTLKWEYKNIINNNVPTHFIIYGVY